MQSIRAHSYLKFNPNTLDDIRECWHLDKGRLEQSLDILEKWLTKQQHIVNKKFDREYLERTLITCKGSVQKAKSQIDRICTVRTLLPKFFVGGQVRKTLENLENLALFAPMPRLTEDHNRIFLIKLKPGEYTAKHIMAYYHTILISCEYVKGHDYANGFVFIEDLRDTNVMHVLSCLDPVELQQFMKILIEGFGARIKGMHFLTSSKAIDILVKTLKSFMSAKLGDRIQTPRNLEELHKYVDKKYLPEDYGGEEKPMEQLTNDWFDHICSEEHEKYMAVMKASCTDESLRSSDKYNEQIMGLPGSFRTLRVD